MAKPLSLTIKEPVGELKKLLRKQPQHLKGRVQMLILIKTGKALTKQALGEALGVSPTTAQGWRKLYAVQGIKALLCFKRTNHKTSAITPEAHRAIELKLKNPKQAFTSYKALQHWVNKEYVPHMKYITLVKYVQRHFGAKLKVARKDHVQKDLKAGARFKKNGSTH